MNIAFVISQLRGGGAERVASVLANAWSRGGHSVCVITLSPVSEDDYDLDDSVQRVGLDLQSSSLSFGGGVSANIKRLLEIRRSIKCVSPDVVISFLTTTNILTVIACMFTNTPVIISERNSLADAPAPGYWKYLFKLAYSRASSVVAQTKKNAGYIASIVGRSVDVVPNPIILKSVEEADEVLELASLCAESHQLILAGGRLTPAKGFDLLLDAILRIKPWPLNWRVIILGEGPEHEKLTKQISELGLTEVVLMPGHTSAPRLVMRLSDVFVLSSRFEGMPNVLMEAMSEGLACASFDCSTGPSDLIQDEVNGLLVSPEDTKALATAIERLIHSEHDRTRFGRQAACDAEKYNVDIVSDLWMDLIRREAGLCGQKTR